MNPRLLMGLALALVSTAAFGTSGPFAKGLLVAGWTPAAAVTWRVVVGALTLLIPGVLAMRGRWGALKLHWIRIVMFGLLAVAGCQLAFFMAVDRLPVAIALLLEYCGVVLVVLWLWVRRGQRPRRLTVVGAAVAVVGLMFVLDVFGVRSVDPIGAIWALAAAAGLAAYFLISADDPGSAPTRDALPPIVLASGGLVVAAVLLLVVGAVGILPVEWSPVQASLAGVALPWWLLVLALALVSTALPYAAGIMGNRRLGSKLASFVGLSEVLFAVVWAWLLLGEMPAPVQLFGGLAILAGVVLIKLDEDSGRGAES
ncbi:MAG: EamA family transporter [Trueperaceae bacterium]|nr:EamA family transporter [Trueperaceae bacterium]